MTIATATKLDLSLVAKEMCEQMDLYGEAERHELESQLRTIERNLGDIDWDGNVLGVTLRDFAADAPPNNRMFSDAGYAWVLPHGWEENYKTLQVRITFRPKGWLKDRNDKTKFHKNVSLWTDTVNRRDIVSTDVRFYTYQQNESTDYGTYGMGTKDAQGHRFKLRPQYCEPPCFGYSVYPIYIALERLDLVSYFEVMDRFFRTYI